MSETLIHWSHAPLDSVYSVEQPAHGREDKPHGLWVSVGDGEDGWRSWCEAESFNLESLTHSTEIILSPASNVLRLQGAAALDAFTKKYGREGPFSNGELRRFYGRGYGIDWCRVTQQYDAILIAPYCWERRLDNGTNWYYSWDCASGCIWNARAVAELRPRQRLAA